eukprot:TRINITY_DN5229_c0_g1_i3.p1 TRINITY_DN5229_c0_g1~~TRINITY_DN5229_c0_g1_i3.p1  ORF type:complete len:531 (+),score=68.60 TRINITY_DN5229_c0_g1_i3:130-1722(+)
MKDSGSPRGKAELNHLETDVNGLDRTLTASAKIEEATFSGATAESVSVFKDLNSNESRHIHGKVSNFAKPSGTHIEHLNSTNATRTFEDDNCDYDSGHENCSVSSFEFHKSDRPLQRRVLGPSSKPAPSKWDDAEKWLVNQNKMKPGYGLSQSMTANVQRRVSNPLQGFRPSAKGTSVTTGTNDVSSMDGSTTHQEPDFQKLYADKPVSNLKDAVLSKFAFLPSTAASSNKVSSSLDRHPLEDMSNSDRCEALNDGEALLRSLRIEKPLADPPFNDSECGVPNQQCTSSTVRSVCMRDMGTEMTPIASQEPSRTGTPVKATTPNARSPVSSRPSTPGRAAPAPSPTYITDNELESQGRRHTSELSEKELHAKTRQEIIALGTKLGKTNITVWARKQEEDENTSRALEVKDSQPNTSSLDLRALAWEEAEKAKYMARHKREEVKIQSWENRQRAKAEAEMRKIEIKAERMRSHAQEKLMNKLAAIQHRVEARRAAAEAKRSQQAAKTSQRAEYIRQTGRIPSPFFSSCCCS